MTDNDSPLAYFNSAELPVQDLGRLAFCGSNKYARLQKWLDDLPATHITQTSLQLYRALPEIPRLRTDTKTRLEMLELMRPIVYSNLGGLARQFLGQRVILPEPAQKAAIVAQALQKSMVTGYSVCVRDLLRQKHLRDQTREQLLKALHRACFSIGSLHLRSCQIYTQLPKGLWLHLHQLFRAADRLQLANTPVADPLLHYRRANTIRDSYVRTAMLACSSTNQLGQQDLELVFDAFENWAARVSVDEEVAPDTANPFVINLSRDQPPLYKELFDGSESDYLLEMDFTDLQQQLKRQQEEGGTLDGAPLLPGDVIRHLDTTWSGMRERQQNRHPVKAVADICVGLSEIHSQLAGGQDFAAFLGEEHAEWSADTQLSGLTPGDRKPAQDDAETGRLPARVNLQNVSAGGYCLLWQSEMPSQIITGQLLGIRESGQKAWHLGVVRWVKQLRGASQVGVQLLALDANPASASLLYDMGGHSDPLRVLMLPGSATDRGGATLVTAAAPFQAYSRVRLDSGARLLTVKLGEPLLATSRVRQFHYQVVDSELREQEVEPSSDAAEETGRDSAQFDSEWD